MAQRFLLLRETKLPTYVVYALERDGIETIDDLLAISVYAMLCVPGVGRAGVRHIVETLFDLYYGEHERWRKAEEIRKARRGSPKDGNYGDDWRNDPWIKQCLAWEEDRKARGEE